MEFQQLDDMINELSIKVREPVQDMYALSLWREAMFSLVTKIGALKLPSAAPTASDDNTSLDPTDWPSARYLAHKMLDHSLDLIQHVRERPVWRPIPQDVSQTLQCEPLPEHPSSLSKVCDDALAHVVPYSLGNTHPRFWGWVLGEGTLGGVLGDMIAASMNPNCGGLSHSAVFVERAVINWMRQVFNFPEAACSGILVSGTTMATVTSLAVARHRASIANTDDGMGHESKFRVYASTETHVCLKKALKLLGFGSEALRFIPVSDDFRIKIDDLKASIRQDREQGLRPLAIVGNAGRSSFFLRR